MDEPLGHLEAYLRVELRIEIRAIQKRYGVTTLYVTHDQEEAAALADRAVVMSHGRIQQIGTFLDLLDRPANLTVAEFVGEPPMNLLPVTSRETTGGTVVQGHGWHLDVDKGRAAALAKRKLSTLTIGIRPEHLRVRREDGSGATGEVRADVYYREPRGDTDILTLRLFTDDGLPSDQMVTAEIPGPSSFRAGEKAMIAIRPEHVHLFAGDTGRRIEALAG
jgi:ABC-type sugar transport system ATPase subunit